MKKLFICNVSNINGSYFIKYVDEIRDEIIVFKFNGEIIIRSSICPHFGGEIYFNKKKLILKCKWHAWEFEPKTGKCLTYNVKSNVRNYEVKTIPKDLKKYNFYVENNEIFLTL